MGCFWESNVNIGDKYVRGKLSREIIAFRSNGHEIVYKNQHGKNQSCWISTWESWVRKAQKVEKVEDAPSPFDLLREQIKDDPEYAWSWHCNIAVRAMDEGVEHALANTIARRVMGEIFGATGYEPAAAP